ncbi:MAG: hypothetical protein ACYDDI_14650 [Candidatus Acidiferrales bacterium]
MTFEHRLLVGFEEIKSVVFECRACKTRVSIPIEEFNGSPLLCPKQHAWDISDAIVQPMPAFKVLASLLKQLGNADFQGKIGFKVFLEFSGKQLN